ncbi:zinc-finger domain-containing protein [Aeribacillus pallidus]|uniref:zinc-finger domain-containing protein n=1 Tax=Aeribacillus pallidus TaxID=33936 RepID=UPI001DE2D5BD|nr:zinc-finger domain-containing protein [Bacillus sp. (in: firmicutes)]
MKRKEVIAQVDELLTMYCDGCWLKAHFRKEFGKTFAHKFCIQQCTVGEKIKKIGRKLT